MAYAVTLLALLGVASPLSAAESSLPVSQLVVVSDQAAAKWDEGHPIGNGRLGLLSMGGWPSETLYLNENSIWARQEVTYNKDGAQVMRRIRELASSGDYQAADRVWTESFLQPKWEPASYEFAGKVILQHLNLEQPEKIRNSLDLRTGVSTSEATHQDGKTLREAVALRERDVIALRISTTRPGGVQLRIAMEHPRDEVTCSGSQITISGQAATGGTIYQSHLRVVPESPEFLSQHGNTLEVNGGKELLLLTNVGTDYNRDHPSQPRTAEWKEEAHSALDRASESSWATLRAEAASEMSTYMDRFSIDLGDSPEEIRVLTTGERIKRYADGGTDPDLEELLFQFGRYCAVASNRPGELPNNLQGIWSEGLASPWSADYHLNINLQMNYWPVEPTGLSELHQPMLDLVSAMQPSGMAFAESLGLEGACYGHAVNAWMNTQFSGGRPLWGASLMNGAWVTAHMMEHYRYTGDDRFLKEQAWPVIQNNARFILSWLQRDESTGEWITGPGTSPENEFLYGHDGKKIKAAVSCGNTHDLMIAWESLSDLIEAAAAIGVEDQLVNRAKEVLPELAGGRIGPDGRMQEWREPFGEAMPGHRHVSHAYGFFPSRQYNLLEHPQETNAIARSLEFRLANGGGHTGWSRAWLINIEACLGRADPAYKNARRLISTMVNPNLFALHPPFQIDANFGYTSGIVTMLMQSQTVLESGERLIWLLPALPAEWHTGEVKGLCSRGGAVIDLGWTPDSVEVTVRATRDLECQVRCRGEIIPLCLGAGEVRKINL